MVHLARRDLIERVRRYLRRHDFVYGYFPQLIMTERASEWWALLWYCVRSLDIQVDRPGASHPFGDNLNQFIGQLKEGDFKSAITLFLEETAGVVPPELIDQLYRSTRIEKTSFSMAAPPSAASYLDLIHLKAVAPIKACMLMNGVKGDLVELDRLATGLGRALQLMDDLLDLGEDLAEGRMFITREELSVLGIPASGISANFARVAALRSKWVMAIIWPAYAAAQRVVDSNISLSARAWFESTWALISAGKAVPLPGNLVKDDLYFAHYMNASTLPFDFFPGSELLKYRLFHRPAVVFLKQYKVFDAARAREMYERMDINLGPLAEFVETVPAAAAEPLSDARQLVDLSESFGLAVLRREMNSIFLQSRTEWKREVATRFECDPARALLDLAGEAADLYEAYHMGDEETASTRGANGGADLGPLVDFGLEYVSLAVKHQFALQGDLLDWLEARARE